MTLPTQLTVLRIALAVVFFVLFALVEPPMIGWAATVFAVAAATDWWDGHLARVMKTTSTLGAFLDPLADKFLTGAALVAFALKDYVPLWMVVLVIARDVYMTVLRTAADGVSIHVKTSYLAKVKTFGQMTFIIAVLLLLLLQTGPLGPAVAQEAHMTLDSGLVVWLMSAITLLTVASAVVYSYDNWSLLRLITRRYILRRTGQEAN
ncbi:MAG: CDP-diacylglycerol--glycerol-3-phosphate 3-phosphatidyltransferase [Bacteroidota bacterium]|nr:CDP-diacylglycerol--glycerol-3-phosphate 3-phosphatidyltransferase [Bacteroidota bacterium]MDP4234530.1 CDP-diacylglycerol--glycerol-3-phosphate 3-phosphatidyltransferase [Bacteroidota bacterium]MDP4242595.1 CDP-diacylglycerol--glycerol-3-phosphate 3-phosphatidyltransferase [Bacteroidota bacterium]MDP4289171.1 CDP-diacylglycerol--glycerol-3-phosphate 3-phosphatidyltransferase [Bacteroidota bacterium]